MGSVDFPALAEQFGRDETGKYYSPRSTYSAGSSPPSGIFPDMLEWVAVAMLMNTALLAVVVRLDANYLEAAAGATPARYERLRRVRGGGAMALGRRGTVPPGAPAARRFSSAPARSPGVNSPTLTAAPGDFMVVLFVLAVICSQLFFPSHGTGSPHARDEAARFLVELGPAVAMLSIFAASLMKFDFRADLDAMDSLKAVPLRPWAISAGQWWRRSWC